MEIRKRKVVKSNKEVDKIIDYFSRQPHIGLDIETKPASGYERNPKAGLDPLLSSIRTCQISDDKYSVLFDLNHVTNIEPLKRLLMDESVKCLVHNLVFETKQFLHHWGVYPENGFCTMLASRLFQPIYTPTYRNSLADVAERELGLILDKTEQKSDWSINELSESQINYAFLDAEVAYDLYEPLKSKLEKWGCTRSAQIEFDCCLPIAELELNGVHCDWSVIDEIDQHIQKRLLSLHQYLAGVLPSKQNTLFFAEPVNLDSDQQVIEAFYAATGIRLTSYDRETGTMKPSRSKSALLAYRKQYPKLVDALLDYNGLSHDRDSFCTGIKKHVHPVTGRLHPEYIQIGQEQGRSAAKKPNMNFARPDKFGNKVSNPNFTDNFYFEKSFRDAFVAGEGKLFSIVDYSQNQLRLISDKPFANIPSLQEEFWAKFNNPEDKFADPFYRIASINLKISKEQVTKQQRQDQKIAVYALSFIASAARYRASQLENTREDKSEEQCAKEIEGFYNALPEMRTWHAREPKKARAKGYTESLFGRKCFMAPEYISPNRAVNFPICMTEVDGMKLALGRISRKVIKESYKAKLAIFVYDESVYEGPENQMQDVLLLQEKIMQDSMQEVMVSVPAMTEGSISKRWSGKV